MAGTTLQIFVVENPVSGVEVSLTDTLFDSLTDSNGSVTFNGVTDIADVKAADPVGKLAGHHSITVNAPHEDMTLILKDSFDLTGFKIRIMDTNGNPVNAAKVIAEQTDIPGGNDNWISKNGTTGSDGIVTLFGFDPLHSIKVAVDLGAAGLVFAPSIFPSYSQIKTVPDMIIPAAPVSNGHLTVGVTHNGITPVSGATVTAQFETNAPTATTDFNGFAVFSNLPVGPDNFPYIWKVTVVSSANPTKSVQVLLSVSNNVVSITVDV